MTNRQKYRDMCKKDNTIPIFSKDWWLDVACGEDNWNVALVERGGEVIASLPYYLVKKFGFKCIQMPKLTQTMGCWIKYPPGQKCSTKLSYEKEVLINLLNNLPIFDSFTQNFDYSVTNWLPFYWHGFHQTTRYTYVIENMDNFDHVFADFQGRVRRNIRKAQKLVKVDCEENIEKFYYINEATFERQNMHISYSLEFLKKIDDACARKGCRKIFFAKDDKGYIHSAIYLIWDENSAYYLMGGSDPARRNSGAASLLMWEAIKFASTVTKKFNFEGSMIESVERYFRSFGAIQKPYFVISKIPSRIIRIRNFIKEIMQ